MPGLSSSVFETQPLPLAGTNETIVKGGRHLFPDLPRAFEGVARSASSAGRSQGPAQAQNLRDSLEGSGIKVKVGLREGSASMAGGREGGLPRGRRHAGRDVRGHPRVGPRAAARSPTRRRPSEYQQDLRRLRPGATLGPLARLPARPPEERRRDVPGEHQRDRRLPEGHGAVGAAPVRAGRGHRRRRHQLQLRRRTRT